MLNFCELCHQLNVHHNYIEIDFQLLSMQRNLLSYIILMVKYRQESLRVTKPLWSTPWSENKCKIRLHWHQILYCSLKVILFVSFYKIFYSEHLKAFLPYKRTYTQKFSYKEMDSSKSWKHGRRHFQRLHAPLCITYKYVTINIFRVIYRGQCK